MREALIVLLLILLVSQCETKDSHHTLIRVDTVRYKADTVRIYQTDTLSLLDTLKMRDTVYILKDWATPKVFINEYSDSNYTLTVTDSINFNKLISQRIQLDISTVKVTGKGSVWLNYQTPVTIGASYQKDRLGVGIGYDILDGSIVTGVSLRVW